MASTTELRQFDQAEWDASEPLISLQAKPPARLLRAWERAAQQPVAPRFKGRRIWKRFRPRAVKESGKNNQATLVGSSGAGWVCPSPLRRPAGAGGELKRRCLRKTEDSQGTAYEVVYELEREDSTHQPASLQPLAYVVDQVNTPSTDHSQPRSSRSFIAFQLEPIAESASSGPDKSVQDTQARPSPSKPSPRVLSKRKSLPVASFYSHTLSKREIPHPQNTFKAGDLIVPYKDFPPWHRVTIKKEESLDGGTTQQTIDDVEEQIGCSDTSSQEEDSEPRDVTFIIHPLITAFSPFDENETETTSTAGDQPQIPSTLGIKEETPAELTPENIVTESSEGTGQRLDRGQSSSDLEAETEGADLAGEESDKPPHTTNDASPYKITEEDNGTTLSEGRFESTGHDEEAVPNQRTTERQHVVDADLRIDQDDGDTHEEDTKNTLHLLSESSPRSPPMRSSFATNSEALIDPESGHVEFPMPTTPNKTKMPCSAHETEQLEGTDLNENAAVTCAWSPLVTSTPEVRSPATFDVSPYYISSLFPLEDDGGPPSSRSPDGPIYEEPLLVFQAPAEGTNAKKVLSPEPPTYEDDFFVLDVAQHVSDKRQASPSQHRPQSPERSEPALVLEDRQTDAPGLVGFDSHLNDDTTMLMDFLDRVTAGKAAKIARAETTVSDSKGSPVRKSRAPLGQIDTNSPSRRRQERRIETRSTVAGDKSAKEEKPETKAGITEDEGASFRRSRRIRPGTPSSTKELVPARATSIPVRRADGSEAVVTLSRNANTTAIPAEVAALTRTNTKRNRGKPCGMVIRRLETESASPAGPKSRVPSRKTVIWDEQLVYFQQNPERPKTGKGVHEKQTKTVIPMARMKGLGNGTPAPAPRRRTTRGTSLAS